MCWESPNNNSNEPSGMFPEGFINYLSVILVIAVIVARLCLDFNQKIHKWSENKSRNMEQRTERMAEETVEPCFMLPYTAP